jgi:hypothetical protein
VLWSWAKVRLQSIGHCLERLSGPGNECSPWCTVAASAVALLKSHQMLHGFISFGSVPGFWILSLRHLALERVHLLCLASRTYSDSWRIQFCCPFLSCVHAAHGSSTDCQHGKAASSGSALPPAGAHALQMQQGYGPCTGHSLPCLTHCLHWCRLCLWLVARWHCQ